jgi:hypothetical protein
VTDNTEFPCPLKVATSRQLPTSQTFTVLSSLPEAKNLPSGLKETERTESPCPFKVATSCQLPTAQTFTVLSLLPEAKNFPSGLNETEDIASLSFHKRKVVTLRHRSTFQIFQTFQICTFFRSIEAKNFPSGLKETEYT